MSDRPDNVVLIGSSGSAAPFAAAAKRLGYTPYSLNVESSLRTPITAAAAVIPVQHDAAVAAAKLAAHLGLVSMGRDAADRLNSKQLLFERMSGHGIPTPRCRPIGPNDNALAVATGLRLPIVVKPDNASWGSREFRVDHVEELPLAVKQARGRSPLNQSVIFEVRATERIYVVASVDCGQAIHRLILGATQAYDFPSVDDAIFTPAACTSEIDALVQDVVDALSFGSGMLTIRFDCDGAALQVADVCGCIPDTRFVDHLFPIAYEADIAGDALRLAMRLPVKRGRPTGRTSVLKWLRTRTGVVSKIPSQYNALQLTGVRHVEITASPGQKVGHLLDQASRDSIGYVITEGRSLEEAMRIAHNAALVCDIAVVGTS